MTFFKDIECNVIIDGKKVVEYDCPRDHDASIAHSNSTDPAVDNYIESQPDQNFAIEVCLDDLFDFADRDGLIFYVYVDGTYMENVVVGKEKLRYDSDFTLQIEGPIHNVNGAGVLQRFRFSKLITDGSGTLDTGKDIKRLASLGDIVVKVFRAKITSKLGETEKCVKIAASRFSEKHAKGRTIDAFTSLDAPVSSESVLICDTTRDPRPLARFVYHYRGRKVLQQLGVVEKPMRERALEERDPATLSIEEMRELLRRKEEVLRQQEDTEKLMKKQLRQARAQLNLSTLHVIKRPRSPSPKRGRNRKDADDDVQIVKRAKKDKRIELVELD